MGILSCGLNEKLLLSFENVFLCLHDNLSITLSKYPSFQRSQTAIFAQELTAIEEHAPYLQKMLFSSWGLTVQASYKEQIVIDIHNTALKYQFDATDSCSTQLSNQRMSCFIRSVKGKKFFILPS